MPTLIWKQQYVTDVTYKCEITKEEYDLLLTDEYGFLISSDFKSKSEMIDSFSKENGEISFEYVPE